MTAYTSTQVYAAQDWETAIGMTLCGRMPERAAEVWKRRAEQRQAAAFLLPSGAAFRRLAAHMHLL